MEGAAIANARAAAAALVRRLDGGDRFSLVIRSDARVLIAEGPIGPRRAAVLARIAGIHTEGGPTSAPGSTSPTARPTPPAPIRTRSAS